MIGTAFAIYAMFDIKASQKYFRLVLLHGPFSGHILWSDKLDEKLELPLQEEHHRHQHLLRAHLRRPGDPLERGGGCPEQLEEKPPLLLSSP